MKKFAAVIALGTTALFLGFGMGYLFSKSQRGNPSKPVFPFPLPPPPELSVEERLKALEELDDPSEKSRLSERDRRKMLDELGESQDKSSLKERIKSLETLNK